MQPDIIGQIVDTPATYDEEGNELTPAAYLPGWHVNTLGPIDEWSDYRIPTPAKPARVYAGGVMPVCYRFPDRETFEALLPKREPEL